MIKIILYSTLLFLLVLYLIFIQEWNYWMFLDNAWISLIREWLFSYNMNFLYSIKMGTYFGFDNSIMGFSRILWSFYLFFWQYVLYLIFFLLNFIFSYKTLYEITKNKKSAFYWGLFFTFNPVSIYFLNLTWFLFAYTSISIILFSVIKIMQTKRFLYVPLLIIWLLFLISYTRVFWLYLLLLLLLGCFYFKTIKKFLVKNKFFSISIIILILFCFLPFLFSLSYIQFSWEKEYFKWVWNFLTTNNGWFQYEASKKLAFYKNFQIEELTANNFARNFKNNPIYIIFFAFFTIFMIATNIVNYKWKHKKLSYLLITIWLWCIFIKWWANFLQQETFVNITYKYIPFIANNTNWLFIILITVLTLLIWLSLESWKQKKIIIYFIYIYIFLSTLPITSHLVLWNNESLRVLNKDLIPKDYVETFYNKENEIREPSIFYPGFKILFKWAPYPLIMYNNANYNSLLTDNLRIVNVKQKKLHDLIHSKDNKEIANSAILNLKNIFVLKNIRNAMPWEFGSYYWPHDNESKSIFFEDKFKKDERLYIKKDSENFIIYWIKWEQESDYLIYSPKDIYTKNIKNFFNESIDIISRPVIIDDTSYNWLKYIKDNTLSSINQGIRIDYKLSNVNPTKFILKISNIDSSYPFLIHLNQTFSINWELKWITKEEFLSYKCDNTNDYLFITNNRSCIIEWRSHLDSLNDYKYLSAPWVNKSNHFEWNFIGNTWLVKQDDIPNEMKWTSELYAVLIYQKQFWYILSLMISAWSFWILLILVLIQESYIFMKKNEK